MKRIPLAGKTVTRLGVTDVASRDAPLEPPAARRLVARLNADRGATARQAVSGDLLALSLIHEAAHRAILQTAKRRPEAGMTPTLAAVRADNGTRPTNALLKRFAAGYPGVGTPGEVRLEDLVLVQLANDNPAAAPLRDLVDPADLPPEALQQAMAAVERHHAGLPIGDEAADGDGGGDGRNLIELLREPARHSPNSLVGQLRFIRETWGWLLGSDLDDLFDRLDRAIGILVEEEMGLHRRFGGGGGDGGPGGGPTEAPSFTTTADEPEAFSTNSAWMPRVVLMAKSTYVWLDQLSRRYGRDIRSLRAIPDEELDRLASWGITGLWLIGLWERSKASERIKRMRGNIDAVASAYSLDDYRIADDLGGEAAYADLRDRAATRGIRLASDMVPNHMGIDSSWVIEHPEWFLSLPEPPYPAYSFTGPDLSSDDRAGIVLEDHYWDDTDAAVVFKRFDRSGADERYIYHGNDGTSFPWNDTAQLDFLQAEVREQVIRTILDVARRFPIIRFDAAMVLAKRHIERLWWPLPGSGDAIPSRAEHALSQAAFDAKMPVEFWREVVDRVAAEVPGTLLLAEAFWMLEGYFVRTLGMHRVYNSAFMHMLRDEDGAGYRKVIKETLEFDPEILKRYVNFMSNPDEKTAVEQFGKGDKYFGVATVLATLPGLPMLGHGQVEGYGEKYGMEFRRPVLDEQPDPGLLQRHEREIFPLLHRRAWFADAHDFLLFDFTTDGGSVDEHVFAYSNGSGPTRSLVLYHDRFSESSGAIRDSVPYARKSATGAKRQVRRSLAEGLGLPNDALTFVTFRDARTGLEYVRSSRELWERGFHVRLGAYQGHVFWEFREVRDGSAGQWRRLAERLGGVGVPSLDDAMRDLQLEPVHTPLRAVFDGPPVAAVLDGHATDADLAALEGRFAAFLDGVAEATGLTADPGTAAATAREVRARMAAGFAATAGELPRTDRAALLGWLGLSRMGSLAPGADVAATSAAWFDELRLAPVLAGGFRRSGLGEGEAWAAADLVRVLLALPRPSSIRLRGRRADARLLDRWLVLDPVRTAIGINTWQGATFVDKDRFEALLGWAARLDAIDGDAAPDATIVKRLMAAAAAADYRVETLQASLIGPVTPGAGRKADPSPPAKRPSAAKGSRPPRPA